MVTCPVSRVTPHSRPCLWVHTPIVSRVTPPPRSCIQGFMSTVSRVTPLPDSEPGVTHPQSLGWQHLTVPSPEVKFPQSPGLPIPRPCTCRQTSTVSRVTPHSRPFSWGHTSSFHGETLPQVLYLGSHIHSLKGDTPPHILYQWSHVQSPGWSHSQDFVPGFTSPHSRWPHLPDTTPRLTHPQSPGWPHLPVLYLGSHIQSLKGDPTS